MVAAYADRRRADYQFREGQDVLINRRRHYRGQFGSDQWLLVPRAVGHFRIKRERQIAIRGEAVPVFHSRDLIQYETRVSDPVGMLPEVAGEDEPERGEDGGGGGESGGGPDGGVHRSSERRSRRRRARSEDPGCHHTHRHTTRRRWRRGWGEVETNPQ